MSFTLSVVQIAGLLAISIMFYWLFVSSHWGATGTMEQRRKLKMDISEVERMMNEKAGKTDDVNEHKWNTSNFPNKEFGRSLQPFSELPKEALLSFLNCCLCNCPRVMEELAHMDAEIKGGN